MEHPPQEADRVRAWPSMALMVAGALVVAAGIASAWWLLRAELGQQGRERGSDMEVTLGPPGEERERMPRRVGGLLQTQIERGEGGRDAGPGAEEPAGPPERWGWADRERGLVRMPIERAMDLVLEWYRTAEAATEAQDQPVEPVEPVAPAPDLAPAGLDEPPGGGR